MGAITVCRRDMVYDTYNRQLKFESDFDKQIKRFLDGSGPRAHEVPPDGTD